MQLPNQMMGDHQGHLTLTGKWWEVREGFLEEEGPSQPHTLKDKELLTSHQ